MKFSVAVAALLAVSATAPQSVHPTAADLREVRESSPNLRTYPEDASADWETDLRERLARGAPDVAAAALATRFEVDPAVMRRLVELWIVAHARQYAPGQDHASWKRPAGAELRTMAPVLSRSRLGVGVLAETLDAIEECQADDFEALVAAAPDRAAEAYHVAAAATCNGNWVRAVLAAPDRALPALVRLSHYGGLSLGDSIAVYAWLTSPAALARVREANRPMVAALLSQRYLSVLFKAGMASRALAVLDAMAPDLRAAVLSPKGITARPVVMDGVELMFGSEANQSPPPAVIPTEAPIYAVAEALTEAGRTTEARRLLQTLPGLDGARAAAACIYRSTGKQPACPKSGNRDLPTGALVLDHLLNDPEGDPYPVAEAALSGGYVGEPSPSAAIVCRVYPAADYPGLCKQAELSGPNNLDEQFTSGDTADMRVLESKALVAAVPGFAAARAALQRDAPPVHSPASTLRATIIAEPPPFAERSITAADHTPATAAAAVALAPLPPGFQLVRAEQQGSRAVAISVSQALDPTGEVSRGGYWVHLSADGGRHWARPMYTGLAERFPYVVEERASAPLLVDETLQLAVSVAEIDTASITYPPVALRTRRRAHGLLLTIPLIAMARDSDGDGISDVAAHHLLLDRPAPERPFRVGSDASAPCGPTTAATMARIALLQRLVDPSGKAIVEPVDRPPAMIVGKVTRASTPDDQPLFLLGNPADFGCLRAARPILVYRHEQIAAITRMTPDFHAFELPPIVFNRTGDRGFARWSTGWAGGTYRLRLVNRRWVFDSINSWIT
ncbi:hypothetical protein [Sphingomonas sp. GV3]|uniref:hypothetical protein n=1 Tax=Sphingomonas sp. GV3 TaxID=3040671 RepID=UPI00280BBFAE|nr:hypothetical protein [Sphingomonas sp. GV3]